MDYVEAAYQNSADSADAAKKAGSVFAKIIEVQSQKVNALKNALEDVRQVEGENGQTVRKLATDYNKAQAELANFKDEAKGTTKETGKLSKSVKKTGKEAKDSTKGIDAMTIALGELVAKGIEMVITGLVNLTEKMQTYNMDMSKLEQNARDAGVSLAVTEKAMRDLNFVTGEADSNIEALSNLMSAGFKDNNLGEAVESVSGAVIKFPDTLKIESLSDSLQETIATKEATGQFAEMLERLGVNVDKFDKGLQRAAKSGIAQKYVLDVLADQGLPKVTEEYSKMNVQQREYSDAQYMLTEAMSDIAKKMVPIVTKAVKAITELLNEHADTIETIINVIGAIAQIILSIIEILAIVPAPVWIIIGVIVTTIAAVSKMSKMFEGAKEALKMFTGGLSPAKMQILQIVTVVIALASVLALLAMLFLAIKEGSEKAADSMERMKNVQIKPPKIDMPKFSNAYAKGTFSAANGWALVGEEGPELVAFSGGEKVLNTRKTCSILSESDNSEAGVHIGSLNVYPNEKQWNQLMGLFKESHKARQKGRKQ